MPKKPKSTMNEWLAEHRESMQQAQDEWQESEEGQALSEWAEQLPTGVKLPKPSSGTSEAEPMDVRSQLKRRFPGLTDEELEEYLSLYGG